MRWQRIIRNYFSYSRGEKRGLLLLFALVLIACFFPFERCFRGDDSIADNLTEQNKLDSLLALLEKGMKRGGEVKLPLKMSVFDPNKADSTKLSNLGFTSRQISNLLHYREKGGRFYSKEDLERLYTITHEDYLKWEKWIEVQAVTAKTAQWSKPVDEVMMFSFDPNTITLAGWDSLGVSPHLAKRIQNYLKSGGRFKVPSDLKKIYGLDLKSYERLRPYISIAPVSERKVKPKLYLGLNQSDSIDWMQLSGIGPVLSSRILKYKRRLGGFSDRKQLLEVYGIEDSLYREISPFVYLDSIGLVKMNINTASARQLGYHPYISGRTARDLIRYRKRNGKFESIDALVSSKLLPDSLFLKLRPYLSVR